jgi:Type I phosphodiesterase / nucleotide pyrophosphatase
MSVRQLGLAGALGATALMVGVVVSPGAASAARHSAAPSKHVLLLSVDGLHQSDLDWYVQHNPNSALSTLVNKGSNFTKAQTPVPSDSFPGMVGQVTGGNPGTTGIYYDDSYNHVLLPAGTTSCAGVAPGTEVNYSEALDKNQNALDAGQGLAGLPATILNMTGNPRSVIDRSKLPVDPATCQPVYPHDYLRVNTIFQVARAAGLRTAWSDKHAAYDILNGPDATTGEPSIQDLFTPEINSATAGGDWTNDNAKTQQYDAYKVDAVANELDGYDHSRARKVGVPAIFGMNFQSVSTAQKLPTSGGQPGGYLADGTPGPVLRSALDFVSAKVGAMVAEIGAQHLTDSTTIILSAKHGQSPTEPGALTRIPDGPILDGLNAAWTAAHPGAPALVAQATNDDAMIMWLSDRSQAAASFAKEYLLHHDGTGNDINGNPKAYTASGLQTVYSGAEAVAYFGATPGDPAVPDIYAPAQHGTVYTGGKKKIAEHGGADAEDRNVPLVIGGAGATGHTAGHAVITKTVETTQIAPTVLRLLGLNPQDLQAVRTEHTQALPLANAPADSPGDRS